MNAKPGKKQHTKQIDTPYRTVTLSKFYSVPLVIPDRTTVRLMYQDSNDARLGGGGTFNFFNMRLNSVYDPDPTLGSGGISGFSEWSNFYRQYRVLAVHIMWQVTNVTGNPPTTLFLCPGSAFPSITTRSQLVDLAENRFASDSKTISVTGGIDTVKFTYFLDLAEIIGNHGQQRFDINYAGGQASNPNQGISCDFCAYCQTTGTLTSNLYSRLTIQYYTEFYDRVTLEG